MASLDPTSTKGSAECYQVEDHLPVPGPDYWSWRCLRCSEPVAAHIGTVRYLFRKVARRLAR